LQLLYIASSWMRDMTVSWIHASFLPSIFDAILLPSPVCETLAKRQRLVGTFQLSVIHAMLERYLIGGRAWNHVLPFPVADR
jgi:hypothetical protein